MAPAARSELLLLPSVAVLSCHDDGRLLLVHSLAIGDWLTVGGMVEPDETPQEAACREAFEETGLLVELSGLRGVGWGRPVLSWSGDPAELLGDRDLQLCDAGAAVCHLHVELAAVSGQSVAAVFDPADQ